MPQGLLNFVKVTRASFTCLKESIRIVYLSEIIQAHESVSLATYIADKAPLFYRTLPTIISSLGEGYFVSTMKETLARLPTNDSFRESHFAEIASCIFAEEVMGLKRLYSKLSLLTAENANAFKMDLVLYKPGSSPVEFVLAEVKSSPKTSDDGLPAGHDKACFAALFDSFNKYGEGDLSFDLSAAKDHVEALNPAERDLVRQALMPYGDRVISYAGLVIIDHSTKSDDEITLLATRKNAKRFDVDVICVEGFPKVADSAYRQLEVIRNACSQSKS